MSSHSPPPPFLHVTPDLSLIMAHPSLSPHIGQSTTLSTQGAPHVWQRCGILCSRYQYIEDLIALESRGMTSPSNTFSFSVSHPLNSGCWEPFLAIHPDQQFAAYLRRGLLHEFHIGFQQDTRLNSTCRNHRSVLHNPVVVHSHVSEEMKAGRLKGPFALTEATAVHISPIGIVPNKKTREVALNCGLVSMLIEVCLSR